MPNANKIPPPPTSIEELEATIPTFDTEGDVHPFQEELAQKVSSYLQYTDPDDRSLEGFAKHCAS